MEPIFVTGHRNPDTDSIVSAMAYAALRNALGENEYVAARLGQVSDETQMVLDRFGFEPPMLLHNVRTQVRDLNYDTPPALSGAVTVSRAWSMLSGDNKILALPVTGEGGTLYGMLTPGDIASYDMRSIDNPVVEGIPVFNLLSALEGRIICDGDAALDTISGEVVIALPQRLGQLPEMGKSTILICGCQEEVITHAIEQGVQCVIVCQSVLSEALRESKSATCIISTPYDAYRAARMIYQSIPINRVCQHHDLVHFHLDDYIDDVREVMLQSRFRCYPILDADEKVAGTLSRFHLIRPRRKRVVLVDHNERAQSVSGLDQAEILEIIDHHRLADVETGSPIYFRNEPVGSTATIIASMYQDKGLMPSEKLAGLMCAAIVSDTIMFKSPTCTERDRRMADRMARYAGISLEELGRDIFSVNASEDKPARDMVFSDFKEFHIAGHSLGIGQITCLNSQKMIDRVDEFVDVMRQSMAERHYDMVLLMLTDVLREGTELIELGGEEIIEQAFNVEVKNHHAFLPKVVSRKKQVVPMLSLLWG